MKIDCPYLQRFHNILCFLIIIDTQNVFPAPDYLLEKWNLILGDITPVIPEDVDIRDINDWENYHRKWCAYLGGDSLYRLKSIFLLSFICSTYSSVELKLKEFKKFGINFREIKSNKSVGTHIKVKEYATKLLFEDCKDFITAYVRELKMEDTLNN